MEIRRSSTIQVLILILLLSACVRTRVLLVNPLAPTYPPVPPEEVVIYTAASELDSVPYDRIAIIEASGSGEYTDQIDMLQAMRESAAEMGANGILLPEIQEPGAGARVAGAIFGIGTQRRGSVVAIRVHSPPHEPDVVDQALPGPTLILGAILCLTPNGLRNVSRPDPTLPELQRDGCSIAIDESPVTILEQTPEGTRVRLPNSSEWWIRRNDIRIP